MGDLRFTRVRQLVGEEGAARLAAARVTICGMGAVGGYALEGLVRAGVGHLRLIDFDELRLSNLNRQLLALDSTLGRLKCEVAAERVRAIHPACEVEALPLFIGPESMDEVLAGSPDLVIDAIDSLNPKVELIASVVGRGVPLISSMGAARRTDPSKIRFGDISGTQACPLARLVRKRLRKRGIARGVRCLYSTEAVAEERAQAEAPQGEESAFCDRGRERETLGSLPTLTGIFGLMIANDAILRLSGYAS